MDTDSRSTLCNIESNVQSTIYRAKHAVIIYQLAILLRLDQKCGVDTITRLPKHAQLCAPASPKCPHMSPKPPCAGNWPAGMCWGGFEVLLVAYRSISWCIENDEYCYITSFRGARTPVQARFDRYITKHTMAITALGAHQISNNQHHGTDKHREEDRKA